MWETSLFSLRPGNQGVARRRTSVRRASKPADGRRHGGKGSFPDENQIALADGLFMSLVLARIDNRLIHGQVLEAWIPDTRANCIVVANNEVAAEDIRKRLMTASVPRGIQVLIESVEESAKFVASRDNETLRVLVLFVSPADALRAYRLGLHFSKLNLGNLHRPEGAFQLGCTVTLDPEDIANLSELESCGVKIDLQCVPSDRKRSWRNAIKLK
jgi:PTS system mannose-specific IIB component